MSHGNAHLAGITRPDIAFAVSQMSQLNDQPLEYHWKWVKHNLQYIEKWKTTSCRTYKREKNFQPRTQTGQVTLQIEKHTVDTCSSWPCSEEAILHLPVHCWSRVCDKVLSVQGSNLTNQFSDRKCSWAVCQRPTSDVRGQPRRNVPRQVSDDYWTE